jgi:uncharacterized protein (TIGR02145 family)
MKKQNLSVFAMLASTLILITSCGSNESKTAAQANSAVPAAEPQKAEQAPVVPTVSIGGINWMTENLKVTTFSNGEPILEAKADKDWASAANSKTPAYRMIDGVCMYNGYVIKDARGIAPAGFKVASSSDFENLIKTLEGEVHIDQKAASAMANYTWEIEEWNEGKGDMVMSMVKGKNSVGFNASKGGFCYEAGDLNLGNCSYWWTSDLKVYDIGYCSQDLGGNYTPANPEGYGFEVRCVKN